ncbi:hypothetical protein [Cryptosporangium phraense]|nr:hypothetical protein [Cryptosporangium phraense]
MMLGIVILWLVIAALAAKFGVDSRDGMDWRPFDEALRRRSGLRPRSS